MSFAELMPTIQSLSLVDKERLYRFLSHELGHDQREAPVLPDGFPPEGDGCGATHEELEESRREVGVFTLEKIWQEIMVGVSR